ncbi:MAG: hypothetical protein A2Z49_11725 [Chloroflexi bacterium RBG_19FT_COMBO_56_12]|nr:MAG: hypothetical protein A2Z49_11725 [Chloroflexi bacterium RBG_19FT_COMBO_56_12]
MTTTIMTKDERQAFLEQPLIAVISIPEPGRGPLVVPVWYRYEPGGDVCVWTGSKSHKAQLLQGAERISICIMDPKPPYKYVSVEGPFSIEPVQFERDVRAMALHYFGPQYGESYLNDIGGPGGVTEDILIRIHPERWHTVDYSKLGPLPQS